MLDHRSLPPVFESRRGHIWRLFHLSLHLITFGGRSAHLVYLVHKSGHKTSIIIINQLCHNLLSVSVSLGSPIVIYTRYSIISTSYKQITHQLLSIYHSQMGVLGNRIQEGDVILSNHPCAGGSHLPDLTVITPVSITVNERLKNNTMCACNLSYFSIFWDYCIFYNFPITRYYLLS